MLSNKNWWMPSMAQSVMNERRRTNDVSGTYVAHEDMS